MRLPDFSRLARRRGAPQLTREEALAARPLRNPVLDWVEQDSGLVLLTVPLSGSPIAKGLRVLFKVPHHRQVELDELGSDIWRWADGETTVGEMVARLGRQHQLTKREVELSLTQFLQVLAKRHFVGLALDLDEERAKQLDAGGKGRRGAAKAG